MNAQDMTFGIEIECTLPRGRVAEVGIIPGGYHAGRQVPQLPEGWNAQNDGSLSCRGDRVAMEIVSPVLRGSDGLRQVRDVVAKLNEWGAKVNQSCGFHVHVGWTLGYEQVDRLVNMVAQFEKGIYATTGTKGREQRSYCQPIKEALRGVDTSNRNSQQLWDRYRLLNLMNLLRGSKPTVEFRAFAGTLNFAKIAAYIRLCVGVVERAANMKAKVKWDMAVNPNRKLYKDCTGTGQVEAKRMLMSLNWQKPVSGAPWGNLDGEGLPTIEESAAELMRLAKKYDGPVQWRVARILLDGEQYTAQFAPQGERESRERFNHEPLTEGTAVVLEEQTTDGRWERRDIRCGPRPTA